MGSKRQLIIEVNQTGNAESRLERLTGSVRSLGSVALGIGAGGLLALGAGAGVAAVSGFSMNNSMEQASATINAFTKDSDKTAEILEMVRERAAKTPFAFNEMAGAAGGLIPVAKQAGESLEGLIQDAEVLAAANPAQGLEGAAFALREAVSGDFTSIIERFNLPRQYINKLKEEGVPALEIVRRAMAEMGYDTDLVSSLAETAEGRWSTFKDTLQGFAARITQPIFDRFSSGLGGVNDLFTRFEPVLNRVADTVGNYLGAGIDYFGSLVRRYGPVVVGFFNSIVEKVNKVSGAFQRFGLRGAAVSILGMLGLEPGQTGTVLSVFDQVSARVEDFVSRVSGAFQRFGLRGAAVSILGMLGLEPGQTGTILSAFDTVRANVQAGFDQVIQIKDNALAAFREGGFTSAVESIATDLREAWNTYAVPVINGWLETFRQWAADLYANIPNYLNQVVDTITNFLSNDSTIKIRESIYSWVDAFWAWVDLAITRIGQFMGALLISIGAWASSEETQGKLLAMGDQIGAWTARGIEQLFANQSKIAQIMIKLAGTMLVAVGAMTLILIDVGAHIVAGIIAGLLKHIGIDIKPVTLNELGKVLNGIKDNVVTIARVVGTGIINGIKEGVRNGVGALESAVIAAAHRALDAAKDWLGIHSPSTAFMEVGKYSVDGWVKAWRDGAGRMTSAVTDSLGQAVDGARTGAPAPTLATGGGVAVGGGVTVILNYQPVISTADQFELERVLTDVVRRINRKS